MGKFLSKLRELDGAISLDQEYTVKCLRSPSPSVNWAFATRGHGLPYGSSMILYGPPKGGKTIICNSFIGQLHKDDPEAVAIVFNTELRGKFQMSGEQLKKWNIDPERLIVYDVNQPELIFDRIEQDIAAACQAGEKIKLIIIDSITDVRGRRSMVADTVLTQQIGDHALTVKDGLSRIIPVIRKYEIALILTDHVRAELDMKEQMRGNTIKMASSWATKHKAEFFCYVEPNKTKEGRVSLAGEEFNDPEIVDFMDKAQKRAHKIRFTVKESSMGFSGRTAEFTLDYNEGIVNQYEEIFTLAKNLGIIKKPNNQTYQYKDRIWRGFINCLTAIRDDSTLQNELLSEIFKGN